MGRAAGYLINLLGIVAQCNGAMCAAPIPPRSSRRAMAAAEQGYVFSPGMWWIGVKMVLSGSDVQILQM